MNCRHQANAPKHVEDAVAYVHVPQGCVCFPDDRFQWLCAQHLDRLDSIPHKVIYFELAPESRTVPSG